MIDKSLKDDLYKKVWDEVKNNPNKEARLNAWKYMAEIRILLYGIEGLYSLEEHVIDE